MKFIDEATITVQSGNGGPGCVSFRRERYIPRGGPDGGDGGKGGDVVLSTTDRKRTLYDFRFKRHFSAENGRPGKGQQKTGRNGQDLIIEVPAGTVVRNAETGAVLKDLDEADITHVVARGGRGGQGNKRFTTSTNRAPRFAQPGEPGTTLTLHLELKLIADVGLVGLPNAGKSTLIRALTAAAPKIADYPFTTLSPNLGVVQTVRTEPFVVADIPGLIQGAHQGAGLGIRFLRHIERTRILVHLIDAPEIDPDDPLSVHRIINQELALYKESLARKPQLVVLNKLDVSGADVAAELFREAAGDMEVLEISAATGQGLDDLISRLVALLEADDPTDAMAAASGGV